MIIVPKFELKFNEETGVYTIISLVSSKCPLCGGVVYHRDCKSRDSKKLNGEVWRFRLRRLICDGCAKLQTELPDIIQPYKHYDSEAIQSVIDSGEKARECVADDSTISRWKSDFAKAEPDIEQRVASAYAQETGEAAPLLAPGLTFAAIRATAGRWLAFVMHMLINAGHKLCTRFAFCPPHSSDKLQGVNKNNEGGFRKDDKTISGAG